MSLLLWLGIEMIGPMAIEQSLNGFSGEVHCVPNVASVDSLNTSNRWMLMRRAEPITDVA